MSWHLKLSAATAAWLAMAAVAAPEPATSADLPTGDVWVTQDAPHPLPAQTAQSAPAHRALPTGDFWPVEEGVTRTADAPAPPKDALAREASGTGAQ